MTEKDSDDELPCWRRYLVHMIAVAGIIALIVGVVLTDDDGEESREVAAPPETAVTMNFNRIASFPVCLQFDTKCNYENETSSEIVASSVDGNTLVYTDGTMGVLGFIDISDPASPKAGGVIDVGGEPTSTAVLGQYAIVCVDTSPNFTNPSGIFHVVDIETQEVLRTGDLGGQPDSIAVSPDGKYAAIVIENERDEEFEEGIIPQLPGGFLQIMDTSSDDVEEWTLATVNFTGLDGALYPTDPEPEYVAINADNIGEL
jgi:DNA-binding beta-propeller fold protein YncE